MNRQFVGTKAHNKTILTWLEKLGAWWAEDETPWCGTFVGAVLQATNRKVVKHWYRAKDWVNAGTKLSKPAYGCLVVFDRSRVVAYVWPSYGTGVASVPYPERFNLPKLQSNGKLSVNEA